MPHRRSNGEGTISHRNNGKWQAAIYIPLPTGTKKRIYFYAKTKKDCSDWLTQQRHSIQIGKPILSSDITLRDWLAHWLSKYCINIRDSTRMNYTTYINRHIAQHSISQIPLKKLTTDDVQTYIIFLQQSGKLDRLLD